MSRVARKVAVKSGTGGGAWTSMTVIGVGRADVCAPASVGMARSLERGSRRGGIAGAAAVSCFTAVSSAAFAASVVFSCAVLGSRWLSPFTMVDDEAED